MLSVLEKFIAKKGTVQEKKSNLRTISLPPSLL